jgi:hypothetical protein
MNMSGDNKESLKYYDLWKYYNGVGSRDKDRMITIVTWHLGTVVLIIGYMATHISQEESLPAIILTILSVLICLVSIYWIYAFAGYANRCWDIADRCEEYVDGLYEFTQKKDFYRFTWRNQTKGPLWIPGPGYHAMLVKNES